MAEAAGELVYLEIDFWIQHIEVILQYVLNLDLLFDADVLELVGSYHPDEIWHIFGLLVRQDEEEIPVKAHGLIDGVLFPDFDVLFLESLEVELGNEAVFEFWFCGDVNEPEFLVK